MSGKKTKAGTRTSSKSAKPGSLSLRVLKFLFTSASQLALAGGELVGRNPVMAGGITAFIVVLGFVSANALWYQPEAHRNVFFQTRPDLTFKATPLPNLLGNGHQSGSAANPEPQSNLAVGGQTTPAESAPQTSPAQTAPAESTAAVMAQNSKQFLAQFSDSIDDRLPALTARADLDTARIQYRLTELGFYKGAIDGFSGPQTREAMERWFATQQKANPPAAPASASAAPDGVEALPVAAINNVAVPKPRPQNAALKLEKPAAKPAVEAAVLSTSSAMPTVANRPAAARPVAVTQTSAPSAQDVVRVQAGLKAFGNDRVPVDGVSNKATQDAVREFRKLFGLPINGDIDPALLGKMREIGLISG